MSIRLFSYFRSEPEIELTFKEISDLRWGQQDYNKYIKDTYKAAADCDGIRADEQAKFFIVGRQLAILFQRTGAKEYADFPRWAKLHCKLLHATAFGDLQNFNKSLQLTSSAEDRQLFLSLRNELDEALGEIAGRIQAAQSTFERRRQLEQEVRDAELDISGELTELLAQMSKDDWHEVVRHWNWDREPEVALGFIVSQKTCDAGTAIKLILSSELFDDLLWCQENGRSLSAELGVVEKAYNNVISGFYDQHEFAAFDDLDSLDDLEHVRSSVASKRNGNLALTAEMVAFPGIRAPLPKYSCDDGRICFHIDYWAAHLSPSR